MKRLRSKKETFRFDRKESGEIGESFIKNENRKKHMQTKHRIIFGSSANMNEIENNSVNLIVTSPPYPMIEMWDDQFSSLNPQIKEALSNSNGKKAYELMHEELNKTWKECNRVLVDGGIACINIGDATRKIDGDSFQLYANHSKITHYFEKLGFSVLPLILWRKETNKPNKYMGSGMLPPSAYVTLEHEYILVFRKGKNREFLNNDSDIRRMSSFFWEERNIWFLDMWNDLRGMGQKLNHIGLRERSAAYPFELTYRLINMYSVQEDTVLDPFLGTGTTMLAAMCSKRNSVGYELDNNFKEVINLRLRGLPSFSKEYNLDRLRRHLNFVKLRKDSGGEIKHRSNRYGFEVMTAQETEIVLHHLNEVKEIQNNLFETVHEQTKFNPEDEEKSSLNHYVTQVS